MCTLQADQPLTGSAPAAGSNSEQEGSSEDCSPSGDLAPAASGLVTSPGMMLPAIAGLPGLSPHEEESRRAQEYWKRAAQPYAIGDTPRLGGPHVSLRLHHGMHRAAAVPLLLHQAFAVYISPPAFDWLPSPMVGCHLISGTVCRLPNENWAAY